MRYHKKVYFPEEDKKELYNINEQLNIMPWKYTAHCLDNLKYRVLNTSMLLYFIKDLKLNTENIFEYYKEKNIYRICYRINWKDDIDIILIIDVEDKEIITIYLNSKSDEHYTLKRELYCNGNS